MKNIQETHRCFNCEKEFKWHVTLKTSKSQMNGYMNSGQLANVAFINKNVIQVEVECSHCTGKNLFDYEIE